MFQYPKGSEEFEEYNNFEALKKLNHCGKTITLDEGKYYYCMPRSDEKEFCFATLGNLNYEKYLEFIKEKKLFIGPYYCSTDSFLVDSAIYLHIVVVFIFFLDF